MREPLGIADRWLGAGRDPFRLLQLATGALLVGGTVVALLLWGTGIAPRALTLAAVLWVAYGALSALWVGLMVTFPEGLARALQDAGLQRIGGFSDIETLVIRGQLVQAADRYAERARDPARRVEATLRRAVLLAGPLEAHALAVGELEALRARQLEPHDDRRVGRQLVALHLEADEPGRAMVELRRLLDLHPDAVEVPQWRRQLAGLKPPAP